MPSRSKAAVRDRSPGEDVVDLAGEEQVGLGLEPEPVAAVLQGPTPPPCRPGCRARGPPDGVLLKLDPLSRVGMLVTAPVRPAADAVSGAPVVVPGAEVGLGGQLEPLAVYDDPSSWRPNPS